VVELPDIFPLPRLRGDAHYFDVVAIVNGALTVQQFSAACYVTSSLK
jgi:hypothetical protein